MHLMNQNRRYAGLTRSHGWGFTLIEMLVVIGVVAVLIAILVPVVGKARESANRVKCGSNLRQIGTAMIQYAFANDGVLPFTSRNTTGDLHNEDWFWWQENRFDQVEQSALAKYMPMNKDHLEVLRCPSDDFDDRPRKNGAGIGPYNFSYAMNFQISGRSNALFNTFNGAKVNHVGRLSMVKNNSEKILMFEEDMSTIDDGNGHIWTNNSSVNLLALRHEWSKRKEQDSSTAMLPVPNPDARGNVLFCDGHVDFIERRECHSQKRCDPLY